MSSEKLLISIKEIKKILKHNYNIIGSINRLDGEIDYNFRVESSDKKEFAAHTLRKKILRNVNEYLTEYPKICYHPFGEKKKNKFSYMKVMAGLKIDLSVQPVNWIKPGESFAKKSWFNG